MEQMADTAAQLGTLPPSEVIIMIRQEIFEKKVRDDSSVDELFPIYGFLKERVCEEVHKKMLSELHQFILTKDLEGFIKWIPKPNMRNDDLYTIDEWTDKFFGDSIDDFVARLDNNGALSTAANEGLEFIRTYKARIPDVQAVPFDFKVLPVRKMGEDGHNNSDSNPLLR